MLISTYRDVIQYTGKLLAVILLGFVPLYVVKMVDSENAYATHSHTYAWFWTMTFMWGLLPAGLMLVAWTMSILACFYCVIVAPKRCDGASLKLKQTQSSSEGSTFRDRALPIGATFIFNICITFTVNALYIYSTQQTFSSTQHFSIQLSLSTFRLLYVAIAFPLLSNHIRNAVDNIRFRFILLTINNLIIPCLVTALTSDACFQVQW